MNFNYKTALSIMKRLFAYVPDNPDVYEFMTGMQCLNFIADVFQVSAADREKCIAEYTDCFEITSSLGDLISGYSRKRSDAGRHKG